MDCLQFYHLPLHSNAQFPQFVQPWSPTPELCLKHKQYCPERPWGKHGYLDRCSFISAVQQPVQIQLQCRQFDVRLHLFPMKITATGSMKVIFLRKTEIKGLLLWCILGVIALDGIQALASKFSYQLVQLIVTDPDLVRMSQRYLATRCLDGRDTFLH